MAEEFNTERANRALQREAATTNDSATGRVIYATGRRLRDISRDALDALVESNTAAPRLFMRGDVLVRLHGDPGHLAVNAVGRDELRGELDRVADFTAVQKSGDVPARPPLDVVRDILAQPHLPFPRLKGISPCPVFLPTSLASASGYDATSGLFLDLTENKGAIRTDLDIDQARRLILDELLGEFPFADQSSRAHAVALLLQPFLRFYVREMAPIYLIEAPRRGTGKGLLAEAILSVALGGAPAVMALPNSEEETEKRITSALLQADSVVLWDNVTSLRSSSLCAVVTTRIWRGRLLGQSQLITLPNDAVWVVTGNNVALSDEAARRVVLIRLDAQVERPETRAGWRHPNLAGWVLAHRHELSEACLSIIQHWMDLGKPAGSATLGRFEEWASTMGGILEAAGIPGFLENREQTYSAGDSESEEWRGVCEVWWTRFEDRAVTAKDVLSVLREAELLLDLWGGRGELSALQRIGRALHKKRDCTFGRFVIRAIGKDGRTGGMAYRLNLAHAPSKNPGNPGNPDTSICSNGDCVRGFGFDPTQNPAGSVENPASPAPGSKGGIGVSGVFGVSGRPRGGVGYV